MSASPQHVEVREKSQEELEEEQQLEEIEGKLPLLRPFPLNPA